jgi:hypothetical protein
MAGVVVHPRLAQAVLQVEVVPRFNFSSQLKFPVRQALAQPSPLTPMLRMVFYKVSL